MGDPGVQQPDFTEKWSRSARWMLTTPRQSLLRIAEVVAHLSNNAFVPGAAGRHVPHQEPGSHGPAGIFTNSAASSDSGDRL